MVRNASLGTTFAVVLVVMWLAGQGAWAASPYRPDDFLRYERLSSPTVSPDGQAVAYVVTQKSPSRDAYLSQVWLTQTASPQPRPITYGERGASHPEFSPDGKWLAVLQAPEPDSEDEDAGDQICLLPTGAPGGLDCLTDIPGGVSDYVWSPDGRTIALVAQRPRQQRPSHIPEDTALPVVIDRLYFKEDVAGYLDDTHAQVFLLDIHTRAISDFTDPAFDSYLPAWSPDGEHIAFSSKRGEEPDRHNNWDVYIKAVAGAQPAKRLTDNRGPDAEPAWGARPQFSPDGSALLYLDGGAAEHIWYTNVTVGHIDLASGQVSNVSAFTDRNCASPAWSATGNSVYCLFEDDRSVQLARLKPGSAQLERLTAARSVVHDFRISSSGVLILRSAPNRPAELLWQGGDGQWLALSKHNAWIAERMPLQVGAIETPGTAGINPGGVHAVTLSPGTSGGELPTLLHLHGGPVAQHQYDFDIEQHIMASAGFNLVAPNPRGSSGRGFDYQYAIWADWGGPDVADVLAVADHLVANGRADPDRLGVYGWSYGGMLTNYTIASDSRFKAAVSGAGIANMLAGFGVDQYLVGWEAELGLPWDNLEAWQQVSYPFFKARDIRTPTLFMVGDLDFNVPLVGSEQMYQALRRLGVPTQLVIYPGEHHSFSTPSYEVDAMQRHIAWFRRYLVP